MLYPYDENNAFNIFTDGVLCGRVINSTMKTRQLGVYLFLLTKFHLRRGLRTCPPHTNPRTIYKLDSHAIKKEVCFSMTKTTTVTTSTPQTNELAMTAMRSLCVFYARAEAFLSPGHVAGV